MSLSLRTFLWFDADLDDVLAFYRSALGDDLVVTAHNRNDDGRLFTVECSIAGQRLLLMHTAGAPQFTDAVSLSLECDGQAETDRLWAGLTADGGSPGQCGWLRDRFGVAWQVSPRQMLAYLAHPDPSRAAYAWQALRRMGKIELAAFEPPAPDAV